MRLLFVNLPRAVAAAMALACLSACDFSRNGPDLKNTSVFIGCYARGGQTIFISRDRVRIGTRGQYTKIVRFLFLKENAAINTINNIEYDSVKSLVKIGNGHTGFFYNFDNPERPSYLSIPDQGGVDYRFYRSSCSH